VQRLQTVLDRDVVQQNSALAIVFVTSLFEFAYAAKDCHAYGSCTDERAFAVAVGVISFFFCLFQLMFVRLGAPAGASPRTLQLHRGCFVCLDSRDLPTADVVPSVYPPPCRDRLRKADWVAASAAVVCWSRIQHFVQRSVPEPVHQRQRILCVVALLGLLHPVLLRLGLWPRTGSD
jgi:hypothetical protein